MSPCFAVNDTADSFITGLIVCTQRHACPALGVQVADVADLCIREFGPRMFFPPRKPADWHIVWRDQVSPNAMLANMENIRRRYAKLSPNCLGADSLLSQDTDGSNLRICQFGCCDRFSMGASSS